MNTIAHSRMAAAYLALRDFLNPSECDLWLRVQQPLLRYRIPLDLLHTDEGAQEVSNVIAQLRDGTFS